MTMQDFKEQIVEEFKNEVEPREDGEDLDLWAICTLDIFRPAFISTYFKLKDTAPLVQVLKHLYKYEGLFTRYGAFRERYISFHCERHELK